MGTCYENPSDVVEGRVGRKLEDQGDTYESYTDQLREGEVLYLGTSYGTWDIVILLETSEEFADVYNHREGKGPYTFYAVPTD